MAQTITKEEILEQLRTEMVAEVGKETLKSFGFSFNKFHDKLEDIADEGGNLVEFIDKVIINIVGATVLDTLEIPEEAFDDKLMDKVEEILEEQRKEQEKETIQNKIKDLEKWFNNVKTIFKERFDDPELFADPAMVRLMIQAEGYLTELKALKKQLAKME